MASWKGLEKSGPLFLLFFLSIFAAIVGFIRGAVCGSWHCSYIFLISAVIFFIWGFEEAQ